MVQFSIQTDSKIPVSVQLYDQLSFAITTKAYATGEQLPSTRQLAQWTGLHRNTINKVYQQLKQVGLVESRGGSGVYASSPKVSTADRPVQIVRQTLDQLLALGYSLGEAQGIFERELQWRRSCNAKLIITAGAEDPGVAEIMAEELKAALGIDVPVILVEDLALALDQLDGNYDHQPSTVVTNRYFDTKVRLTLGDRPIRVFTIDIHNYSQEIACIRTLPVHSSVGLVSISAGILRLAESLIQSIRPDVLVISVLAQDTYRLAAMLKTVDLVITGHSAAVVKQALAQSDRLRPLQVIYSGNYIAAESIKLLQLELGIT